jgi:hypothetical protein
MRVVRSCRPTEIVKVVWVRVDSFAEGGGEKAQRTGVVLAAAGPRALSMLKLIHVTDGFGDVVVVVADGNVTFAATLVEPLELASPG